MNVSDDLFHIIKSLSINEKRHFKLFSFLQRGEKKYLKIFDAIDAQHKYDEKAILKKFSKEKFIKNFSVAKAYLYDSILKSLELYNADSTDTLQLRKLISRAELLASKRLIDQALKLIRKAKHIAEENDCFTYQQEASQMEQKLMANKMELKWLKENKKNVSDYEDTTIENLKLSKEYRSLEIDLILWVNSVGNTRSKEDLKKFELFENFHLLKNKPNTLSTGALISHYHSNATYYYVKEDFRKSLKYCIVEKNTIEQTPARRKKYLAMYIYTINNILTLGINLLSYEELMKTLESLKKIKDIAPHKEKEVMSRYYPNALDICGKHLRITEGLAYAKEAKEWLLMQDEKSEIAQIKNIYYNLIFIYFLNANYKEALKSLNKFLQMPEDIDSNLTLPAQLVNMIIHYELGNYDLLEYIVKSNYRYLYKHKKIFKYEDLILDFIRNKMSRTSDNKEIISSFKILKKQLELIIKDPYEKKALEYFDFISWLDSKIQNRPFVEIVREKFLQKNSLKSE